MHGQNHIKFVPSFFETSVGTASCRCWNAQSRTNRMFIR